jgi:hypothetical protein
LKRGILLLGGLFFFSIGVFALAVSLLSGSPAGLFTGGGTFGATLGSLLAVVVGLVLIRAGTRRGRFSKRNR